jgi:hypothetical protein
MEVIGGSFPDVPIRRPCIHCRFCHHSNNGLPVQQRPSTPTTLAQFDPKKVGQNNTNVVNIYYFDDLVWHV